MTLLAGAVWTIVDDDGTGTTGTPLNAAWVAAVKASIEDAIHSATNPTDTLKDIIDEIVDARGGFGDLDARLDAMDTSIGSVPTVGTVQEALGTTNMVKNEIFLIWTQGDTSEPAYWDTNGAGSAIARAGTGLADTNRKVHDFSAKFTRLLAVSQLFQQIFNNTDFALVQDSLRGRNVGFGAWVRSSGIAGARVFISDGVGTTLSTANAAAGVWEWLSVERVLDSAATNLTVGVQNDTDGSSLYLSAPTCVFAAAGSPPADWIPSPVIYENHHFHIAGNVATTQKFFWQPSRPGIVKDVQLIVGTAPVGAALIVDVNSWDGAAFTSMYSTRPTIADGANRGGAQPDTTYARRCIGHGTGSGTGVPDGAAISIDIDQVGSGTPGANLGIMVRTLHYANIWEAALTYNFAGS